MKRIIKNNYKFILGTIFGLILSITSVYAVEAYIESKKVFYDNTNSKGSYKNVQESIDELYERSGIHKEKWIDPILNGADPVLKEPLIPVEIKPNGDVYYANENSEWYNYSEKRWANAVILVDNPSNTNYKVGDQILGKDIESYFVWIPRYQYKIWNMGEYNAAYKPTELNNDKEIKETSFWKITPGNNRLIDVKFGTADKIPKMEESAAKVDEYYTHPAFTLGIKNLNGIWVGKFETGGTIDNIIVKPTVSSLRNQTVKVLFNTAKGYNANLDSHMMKNTEWGAVAYLSQSVYGISAEIRLNNNTSYKTGYSAAANTDQSTYLGTSGTSNEVTNTWETSAGYLASTTGNISGVYDMSGGAGEFVAACVEGASTEASGFSATELAIEMNNGYIDKYPKASSAQTYNYRLLGDATGEMGPFYSYSEKYSLNVVHSSWYSDMAYFVYSSSPWFLRGGNCWDGRDTGIFNFNRTTGEAGNNAFHLVLSPT